MTMFKRSIFLAIAVALASVIPPAVSWHRLALARHRCDAARIAMRTLQTDAQEVLRLRGQQQRVSDRKRPEQDMIARVHAVLQQAGLPVKTHFQSLRLESDSPLAGSSQGPGSYRRQSVAVALGKLTVQQIGSFLLTWRADQPLWSPTRIELAHIRGDVRGRQEADRYDLAVTFSAVYVAQDTTS